MCTPIVTTRESFFFTDLTQLLFLDAGIKTRSFVGLPVPGACASVCFTYVRRSQFHARPGHEIEEGIRAGLSVETFCNDREYLSV
jgi:hypothetical protein